MVHFDYYHFHSPLPIEHTVHEENSHPPKKSLDARVQRAFTAAMKIGKGLVALEKRGIKGRILHEIYWNEALLPEHPYGNFLNIKFTEWVNSDSTLSFKEWIKHEPIVQVTYYQEEEKDPLRTDIEGNYLTRGGKPYSTLQESTVFSGPGTAIFIIDAHGKLYCSSHVAGKLHHSSISGGEAVLGAGEIKTDENGKITFISNKSGHYRPNRSTFYVMLKYFKEQGVDLSTILLIDKTQNNDSYYNAEEYFKYLEKIVL